MRAFYKTGLIVIALFAFLQASAQKVVGFKDEHIGYMGRIAYQADAAKVFWSGSYMLINFRGTEASVTLKDERGDNYFNIIIDGKVIVLHPDAQKRTYQLAKGLAKGPHTLMIFKRTEWADGTTLFYGFQFNDGAELLPLPPAKKRKIEFYGDSITSGYGVEDFDGGNNSYLPPYKNNYITYAALTARHFDAQYSCISKSGIGITVGYTDMTMPELYDRLDPNDPNSRWDFAKYAPDVVVVNLFQNDASMMRQADRPQFKARFGDQQPSQEFIIETYRKFIQSIRSKYPNAQIICALGDMDACKESLPWRGYVEKAVSRMKDNAITAHFFAYKNTPGHPSVEEQQAMADDLIKYITNTVKW
ncbi:lysophospholipase L1-like esterase [Mucilaginibacter gracilis]|uniref:Lysophospholipase L1-like esterase n=1 Tax=Mucilaginibacter gracilis TaxID=423350 RepID=A0A495JAV0_9SPHI|nr:SGNH/GDSL hydrolase family protein [Mucilaginibacter gracilis]RKR85534.1 lysophospholipase L1-like esterase [Mucilaginibacter gracilis]